MEVYGAGGYVPDDRDVRRPSLGVSHLGIPSTAATGSSE